MGILGNLKKNLKSRYEKDKAERATFRKYDVAAKAGIKKKAQAEYYRAKEKEELKLARQRAHKEYTPPQPHKAQGSMFDGGGMFGAPPTKGKKKPEQPKWGF